MLLIFFGNIGTGKSTIARKVAEKLGFEFINFDNVMWEAVKKDKMYSENDEFLLTMREIQSVYDYMHEKAKELIKQGKGVVLESMYFKKQRDEASQIAKDLGINYKLIEILCHESEIKKRVEKRKQEYPQTAGFQLYLQYKNFVEKEDSNHFVLDTTNKTPDVAVEELLERINNSFKYY